MNKIAISLFVLAGISSAAFASQRNQDPDFVSGTGGTAVQSEQGAAVVYGASGVTAWEALRKNMEEQSQSNRK